MIRFLPVPVAGCLLAVALSGCSGPSEPMGATGAPIRVTDPTDTSQLQDAGPHIHDYWAGEPRKRILEAQRDSEGLIASCTGWSWEMFRPATGETVLQGTATVEVTLSWTPGLGDQFRDPELWVKTAADSREHRVQRIQSGQTVAFAVSANQSDLPHSVLSNWQIHWFIHPGNPTDPFCSIRFSGRISIRVEIVRGLEIEPFPGHPDLWRNETQLKLLQGGRDVRFYQGPKAPGAGLCLSDSDGNCLWKPHVTKNGTIVPYDAATVQVTVRNNGAGAFELGFAYHGADTWDLTYPTERIPAGTTRTYDLALRPNEGDGPYAIQSLWEFWTYPTQASQVYAGTYSIEIQAVHP